MTAAAVVPVGLRARRPRARATLSGSLLETFRAELEAATRIVWPDDRYQKDPVGFAHNILGVGTWEKQDEILEAYRDHERVSVRSGHKVSKSHTAAIIATHFYCSYPEARVVMSSVTARQVDAILWREVHKMKARAGRCVSCKRAELERAKDERREPAPFPCPHSSTIDGKINDRACNGMKAADHLREIVGFTAKEAEAVAGVSGENLLYIIDEASGVPDLIFEAIEGNRAGGARIVLFSNPTRTEGEFYESHTKKALRLDARGRTVGFYKTIQVSSEETPNVKQRRKVIPGLATYEYIEEKKREWGEDSPIYKVRIKGEFVENEDGKILSLHDLTMAEARWDDAPDEGRLYIGLDPAGPGDAGDDSVFAPRRGAKVFPLHVPAHGLTAAQHVTELLFVIKAHRRSERDLPPVVVIDRDGPIGAEIYGLLRAYAEEHPGAFVVVGVRGSDRARREPLLYDRIRDEVWANLAAWLKRGGAIPEDGRLTKELHTPSWYQPLGSAKLKVTSKKELRKLLDGQSPDRADAVALSVWEGAAVDELDTPAPPAGARAGEDLDLEVVMDPYAGLGIWERR